MMCRLGGGLVQGQCGGQGVLVASTMKWMASLASVIWKGSDGMSHLKSIPSWGATSGLANNAKVTNVID